MSQETVAAGPTKRFFVDMLTRDIELKDAILDLLDNCIDGVLRQIKGAEAKERPYDDYWAKITARPDCFEIVDNCGGIPAEIAKKSAFVLGRPNDDLDSDIESVGMYGIGMKRAIFKMGQEAKVTSKPKDEESYHVDITPEWLKGDDWVLPMTHADGLLKQDGTEIRVTQLHSNIARNFDLEKSDFLNELAEMISQLFAVIIEKGFAVYINDKKVEPTNVTFLFDSSENEEKIMPYAFQGQIDGVTVDLVVGFYRKLATERELDDEAEIPRSSDHAGWTVICNDRVVMYADKSVATGWGRGDVPKYHTQFISIAGVVNFHSTKNWNLPLNTTKRGIDANSDVYAAVLDIMMEGVKKFTNFTNKWKSREHETKDSFTATTRMKPLEIVSAIQDEEWKQVRKLTDNDSGRRYVPKLPVPSAKNPKRRIVFTKKVEEILLLANHFFDSEDVKPSDVGERCFDEVYEQVVSGRRGE